MTPLLAGAASFVFAISLLASDHSSSTVGTMAGQVIMQGFIHRKIPMWSRRILTMVPSFVVIGMRLDPTSTLVLSQVVLSFGLPFAIIPLVVYTARRDVMGALTTKSAMQTSAVAATNARPCHSVGRRGTNLPRVRNGIARIARR